MTHIAKVGAWNEDKVEMPHWAHERNPSEQAVHEEQQRRIVLWRSGILKAFGEQDAITV